MEFCRHRGHICPAVMNNIIKPVNQLMFYVKNLHIKPFEHIHVRDYRYSKPCCHKSGYDLILLRFACYLRSFAKSFKHLIHQASHSRSLRNIFSMDGDVADLQELCDLKREYDTFLYVDEAHAVGVRGTNGLGCCEEQGCIDDIDFIVGTFGKAFASYGAFVVCDEMFRDFLVNTQRSLIFTTALPPVNVAWTRFILNRMPDFYSYRMKLSGIAEQLRTTLANRGFETRGDSHIVPFLCGSNENSVYMSELFQDNGFFVLPVRYPTVPKNEARIRFSLNAAIPEEDYDCLMEFIEISL